MKEHEVRIRGGSREYTLDGANTFTNLMKHKHIRHTHE